MREPAIDTFSYATADDTWLKRVVIGAVEKWTGQPYLKWLYEDYQKRRGGENVWDAAVKQLELTVVCNESALQQAPKTGPLVIVANHPFGVLDGVVIAHLVHKIRDDFKVLTNSVLYRAEELRPYLIPIDFGENDAALETNLASRAEAKTYLAGGGCLVVFPGGGAATTPNLWSGKAEDLAWKKFAAALILQVKAPVLPIFFAGQNSRLFQVVSHFSMTLRLALFFHEVHNKIGSEVHARIGDLIPFATIARYDRNTLTEYLRRIVLGLGRDMPPPPQTSLRRPRRAPVPAP